LTKDDIENNLAEPRSATDVLIKANIENNSNSRSTVAAELRSAAQLYERILDYWRRPFITLATCALLQQHCPDLTAAELDAALACGLRRGELQKLGSVYVISSWLKATFDVVTLGQH